MSYIGMALRAIEMVEMAMREPFKENVSPTSTLSTLQSLKNLIVQVQLVLFCTNTTPAYGYYV
jgi:hypothetical protein